MALKKVALRKLEDGIPNQALREIKALQEIEDNPYVSVCNSLQKYGFMLHLILVNVQEQPLWAHLASLVLIQVI